MPFSTHDTPFNGVMFPAEAIFYTGYIILADSHVPQQYGDCSFSFNNKNSCHQETKLKSTRIKANHFDKS